MVDGAVVVVVSGGAVVVVVSGGRVVVVVADGQVTPEPGTLHGCTSMISCFGR